jgi:hypothetical protein
MATAIRDKHPVGARTGAAGDEPFAIHHGRTQASATWNSCLTMKNQPMRSNPGNVDELACSSVAHLAFDPLSRANGAARDRAASVTWSFSVWLHNGLDFPWSRQQNA